MSDADCFFEYPSRWQQLYEAFLSQDEGQLQQAIAQLEERDIALEDHLRNRPCGCTEIIAVSGSKFDHGYLNVEHDLVVTERTWAHVTLSGSVTNGTLPGVIELSSPAGQAWAQTFETSMDGWMGSASMTYVEQLDPSPWAQWVGGALFIPSAHFASLLVSIILSPCGEGSHVSHD